VTPIATVEYFGSGGLLTILVANDREFIRFLTHVRVYKVYISIIDDLIMLGNI